MKRARAWLPLAVVLLAYAAVYARFAHLLVFVEARGYLMHAPLGSIPHHLAAMWIPSGWFSRDASQISFALSRALCGYRNVCLNDYQLTLVAIGGAALYAHVLQVVKDAAAAAFACVLWLFSLATLDANSWQAVMHDKLGLCFSLAALLVSHAFVNRRGIAAAITANVSLTVLLAFAYNSKESTFFLAPALVWQTLCFSDEQTWRGRARALANLAAPMIFSLYFVLLYLVRLAPSSKAHALSASASHALFLYGNYLFNVPFNDVRAAWALAAAALVAGAVLLGALSRRGRFIPFADARPIAYFGGLFALALLPVIRASYPAAYYMLIPGIGFYALVVSLVRALVRAARFGPARMLAAYAVACAPFLYRFQIATRNLPYAALLESSRSFEQSLATLTRLVPDPTGKRFHFVFDRPIRDEHYLLMGGPDGGLDPAILSFAYKLDGDFALDRAGARAADAAGPSDCYLFFDGQYRIRELRLGDARLYPAETRP